MGIARNLAILALIIPILGSAAGMKIHPKGLQISPARMHLSSFGMWDPCASGSCYPATGNLLVGREMQLTASSTCGMNGEERYCIVSHLEDKRKCFRCDSRNSTTNNNFLNHEVRHIVNRVAPGTKQRTWWQSEKGEENVSIRLDLEDKMHLTHIILLFKTFRPAAMFIERSSDNGMTWKPYRYFADNCAESFPGVPQRRPENYSDVICESRYSSLAPSTEGEVIFRVLPKSLNVDVDKDEIQDLLQITNLRVNFVKLHKIGDDVSNHYYALYEMIVRGTCSCNGHAVECLAHEGEETMTEKVYGKCDCRHNTTGDNCEQCKPGYYRPPGKTVFDFDTCAACACDPMGSLDNICNAQTGQCNCRPNASGLKCENINY